MTKKNEFALLCDAVETRGISVGLERQSRNGKIYYRIVLSDRSKQPAKTLEYEDVRESETVERAAQRMHARLTRSGIVKA